MKPLLFALCLLGAALAADDPAAVIESHYSTREFDLTADPAARQWKNIEPVLVSKDFYSKPITGAPTEIRSRWTNKNLYLLYSCPYKTLTLKPEAADTKAETPVLWNWDVAEAFIGWDKEHIARYKEFQVSPRGEWIDLDIDRENPKPNGGADWNSGYEVKARVDEARKIWYGEMRIPMDQISPRPAKAGEEFRTGLYRLAGAEPNRQYYAWRPTGQKNFHVPQAFGRLRLAP